MEHFLFREVKTEVAVALDKWNSNKGTEPVGIVTKMMAALDEFGI